MALRTTPIGDTMTPSSTVHPRTASLRRVLRVASVAVLWACGCAAPQATPVSATTQPDATADPKVAAYEALIMPASAHVLAWTKPISIAADGSADGIEAIVELLDGTGDQTKATGLFHFELESRRASDQMGARVAFWAVEVASAEALRMYRDPLSRYYHFPLRLEQTPLPAGRYVLTLTLHLPGGKRLFGEYEFEYDGGAAPPPSIF